jgi:uncharacterized protein
MPAAYTIIAHDKPGANARRLTHLAAHLAHVEANLGQMLVAGPLRNADGEICASLLVVKAETEAEARAFLEKDPYFAADIWDNIEIHSFNAVAGDWVGGRAW